MGGNMKGLDYAVLAVVALLAFGLGALAFAPEQKVVTVTSNNTVEKLVLVPANSTLQDEAAAKILEEDNFEDAVYALAVAELEERGYRNIFIYLEDENYDISEKEDISKIKITDSDVSNIDVDEGNAEVEIELRVYYEDFDGDNVREDLIFTAVIEDNEVEDFEFDVA